MIKADIRCANGVIHVIDTVITPPAPEKITPRDVLALAIDRGVPLYNDGHAEACAAIYEVAAHSVIALSGDALHTRDRQVLVSALERAEKMNGAKLKAWELRRAFDKVLHSEEPAMTTRESGKIEAGRRTESALRDAPVAKDDFRVTMEAPLPEGFPGPGPVGQVVLKEYPSYRMARSSGGSAFGSLFMHIKRNDIAMTTPVEMTMQAEGGGELRQQDMAFLYESTEQGRTGRDGRVTVMDRESVKVLSIGLRGPLTTRKMNEAKRSVEASLANAEGWERSGRLAADGLQQPLRPRLAALLRAAAAGSGARARSLTGEVAKPPARKSGSCDAVTAAGRSERSETLSRFSIPWPWR